MLNCAADECGEDLMPGPVWIVDPAVVEKFRDEWERIARQPRAYLVYRPAEVQPMPVLRIPLWSQANA